jgi:thymidylate synthase ThyX
VAQPSCEGNDTAARCAALTFDGQANQMARVVLHDEFDPESTAMLQALYSRSAESVETHVEKLKASGSSRFMERYYVGYGHASIGDCGTTTLFIEGVSILCDKAIQDNPLYSGQETSTRYIDFSQQIPIDPVGIPQSKRIQSVWLQFYTEATPRVREFLSDRFPRNAEESKKAWEKAIKARAFDVMRGFLPAGVTTQLSWTTNLRQAYDRLSLLRFHPLEEVRGVAKQCFDLLREKYPSSFSFPEEPDRDAYYQLLSQDLHYSSHTDLDFNEDTFTYDTNIDTERMEQEAPKALTERPLNTCLPRYLSRYGRFTCRFLLDYGSFRDLQRHRNGLCRIPLLGGNHGFKSWYLIQLPGDVRREAETLVRDQWQALARLKVEHRVPNTLMQYYYPLGTNALCEIVYDLPQMVYVAELRSGLSVHPTLRAIAHKMHAALVETIPQLKLHTVLSEDIWHIGRGFQDIETKEDG